VKFDPLQLKSEMNRIHNEKAPVTLYYQLKEMLTLKIKNSEWAIDAKIPPERELCDMYKLSRITVRKALEELEREGYLKRKQGKGTFVTSLKIEQRLSKFYSFSEEIKKMGYNPSTRIFDFSVINSNEDLSRLLGVEKNSRLYSIKRLRLANNEPFALETSYIPYNLCPELNRDEVSLKGLYNTMRTEYNIIPEEATETFEAVIINKDDGLHLQVKKNSPGILLERLTSQHGIVVEYCISIIRGDRYKYKVELK
jgi:GntR family transcriptional regulator